MRRRNLKVTSVVLLVGAACGFAAAQIGESPLPGARPASLDEVAPFFPFISDDDALLYSRLNEKVTADFVDLPLDEAIQTLARRHKLPLVLNEAAFDAVDLPSDFSVTVVLHEMPLRVVLKRMQGVTEFRWEIRDGLIQIVPEEVCEDRHYTAVYPVADLVSDEPDSWDELTDLIRHLADVDLHWEEGGDTQDGIFRHTAGKSLVIARPAETHLEIQRLFTALRSSRRVGRERLVSPAQQPAKKVEAPPGGAGFF